MAEGPSSSGTNVTTESLYSTLTALKATQWMKESDHKNNLLGIFIEPPEDTEHSDDEQLDEATIGEATARYKEKEFEHLTKQHYEAYAEIAFVNHKRIISVDKEEYNIPIEEEEEEIPHVEENIVWEHSDIMSEIPSAFCEPTYNSFKKKTPLRIFEQFFDTEIISHIIDETSKYTAQKGVQIPTLTPDEVKIFVAILLLSGYRGTTEDLRKFTVSESKMVMKVMQQERFDEIFNIIHFADNTNIDKSDKMWKLRPIMNLFQNRFLKMFKPEEHLTFGECMVDSCRRHNYVKWDEIPFGYKIFCLNTSSGYLVNFEVFQRKNVDEIKHETAFGVYGAALVEMLDGLPANIAKLPFKIYFNRFFTSMALFSHLKERGYDGTGTFKSSALPKSCPLPTTRVMKTRNIGALEFVGWRDKNVLIARMKKEKSVITVGSTYHGVAPYEVIVEERRSKTEVWPSIVANYDAFKRGVTRMEEKLEKYDIKTKGKKWYWPLFTWLLDVAVHNSWLLKKKSGSSISEYEFRRDLVIAILENADDTAGG